MLEDDVDLLHTCSRSGYGTLTFLIHDAPSHDKIDLHCHHPLLLCNGDESGMPEEATTRVG